MLADNLYSKDIHFILELIQNAEDNHYAPGVKPTLKMCINSEKMYVFNNEVGFSDANVEAV